MGAAGTLILAASAGAATLTFDINPGLSSIGLAGAFGAIPLFPQAAGADITSYSGTIRVSVDDALAPTSIEFVSGGSAIAANSGDWLPNDVLGCGAGENCGGDDPNTIKGDADPGAPAPANYGLGVFLTSEDLGLPAGLGEATALGAVRGLTLSLTSGAVPLVGGAFDSTQLLAIDSGAFDTNINSTLPVGIVDGADTDDLSGDTADGPNGAGDGMYAVVGNVATLTVPMSFLFSGDVTLAMTGALVATRVVPEPSSLWLVAVGGAVVLAAASRRRWST
jgi:hypothetical protein